MSSDSNCREKCTAHITDCDMIDDDSSSCHVKAREDEAQLSSIVVESL